MEKMILKHLKTNTHPKTGRYQKVTCCLFTVLLFIGTSLRAQQIDRQKLDAFMLEAEQAHSEAVLIYQNGQLVSEKYFGRGHRGKLTEAMSATKSIVGLAMACILSDRLIDSLDVPVHRFYPEWKQGKKQFITIRQLVNMTSGLQNNPNAGIEIYPSRNFVQLALAAELSSAPGEQFSYNNKALNLIAGLVEKITHKRMDRYIGERLFKRLGITRFSWTLDTAGNPHVMSGCQIAPEDFAKIGMLMLGEGVFRGQRVISSSAFKELVRPVAVFKGYSMLWWLDYSKTVSVIDDDIIVQLKRNRLPEKFINQATSLMGSYNTQQEYLAALKKTFGEHALDTVSNYLMPLGLQLRKRLYSGDIIYRADGYLGNYIIVDPKKRLVAVRMTSSESFKTSRDNFPEFKDISTEIFSNP